MLSWCFVFFNLPLQIFPLLFSKSCFNKGIQRCASRTIVVPCVAAIEVSTLDTFVVFTRTICAQYLSQQYMTCFVLYCQLLYSLLVHGHNFGLVSAAWRFISLWMDGTRRMVADLLYTHVQTTENG